MTIENRLNGCQVEYFTHLHMLGDLHLAAWIVQIFLKPQRTHLLTFRFTFFESETGQSQESWSDDVST